MKEEEITMRIAFAGNPNSGKTTMYNALTGRNEKVGKATHGICNAHLLRELIYVDEQLK